MRWADLDLLQHVNNVAYMDYLQDARVDFFRTVAPGLRADARTDAPEALVVVSHDISYFAPMALHTVVEVECWISEVRAATFAVSYDLVVERDGERVVHARATTVLAPFVFAEERPRRLSAEERALLKGLLVDAAPAESFQASQPHVTPEGTFEQHVRFSDVDAYGHVNNVMYFEYLQEARVAFVSRMRKRLSENVDINVVVARTQLEYVRPMFHRAAPYTVHSWISRVGGKSMVVESAIVDGGELLARASVVLVFFDRHTQRSAAPPAELHELVESFLAPASA